MKTILAFLAVCAIASAQAVPYPIQGSQWYEPLAFVPAGNTAVTTSDSLVHHLHLANTTGGTCTVTVTDTSVACGGSPCAWWPAITIAANTVYDAFFSGMVISGGIKWQVTSGGGSAVVGYMDGFYTRSPVALNHAPYGDVLAFLELQKHRGAAHVETYPLSSGERASIDAMLGEAH